MAGRRHGDNVGDGQLAFDLFSGPPADDPATPAPTGEGGTDEQVRTPGSATLGQVAAEPAQPDPGPGGVLFEIGPAGRAGRSTSWQRPGRGRPGRGGLPGEAGRAEDGSLHRRGPSPSGVGAAPAGAGTPGRGERRHPDLAGDDRLAADGADPGPPGLPRAGRRAGAAEGEHTAGQQPLSHPTS
jgi:hypothetical protein